MSENVVTEWKDKLPELTKDYAPKDQFNFDETGVFYKLLPKKSYFKKGVKAIGLKKRKQRITIGFCCSEIGEKLKPLIIGTARKPRCFRDIKYSVNSLGVDYYHNSNAWMTQCIFDQWLVKNDKIFLCLQN